MDVRKLGAAAVAVFLLVVGVVWFLGSANPQTEAGYVGYLTKGAVFGKTTFYGLQTGPTSPGRTWMLNVTNISITPYTYTEEFCKDDTVLSQDKLKLCFRVHVVWSVKRDSVKDFVEKFSVLYSDKNSDKVVLDAYNNYLKEPLRTAARDEVQKHKGLDVQSNISAIGDAVYQRVLKITDGTPFAVSSVVVGNIQYPPEVADAVSRKLAATQELEQMKTQVEIERQKKERRIIEAEGLAAAMEKIQVKLTPLYVQHEAIEAQKMMVGSPNHTTIYIPVGPMGVPIVGTLDTRTGATPVEKK